MTAIIIHPKDAAEFELLSALLKKMKIKSKTLSQEELEDVGLALLMKDADRKDQVGRESVMAKLRSA